ncbi:MutS-related protein [Staphylococcus felis]|uniref:MutS-related protein n=1 Tax=Staphylococcus felis TaxID=46127 RepID=UPI000E21E773|nr:AAA family ATPase [Staphylococcus felis]REH77162.1 MutS family DNA mismatch repair protein [Staphylococcus felis]REI31761.1 MutS family DNA mismatch repair protein [Staphylococcus felis]
MSIYQVYLFFVTGIIVVGFILGFIVSLITKKKLVANIQRLWEDKKPSEEFIRPNARFDYQFKLRRDNHTGSLVDDKTWSDLNFDTIFHRSNFNFTAIGEMKWYATLRNMFSIQNDELLERFTNEAGFRTQVAYRLALIGKVTYPLFPDQIAPIKRNNLFMLCPFLPLISIVIAFINPSIGILFILLSVLFNIGISAILKKSYNQDLMSLFYSAKVLKQSQLLSRIEGTPKIAVAFQHFKGLGFLVGFLSKADSQSLGGALMMLLKLSLMLDYFFFHIIQSTYYKYQNELLECYDYISNLDNQYTLAMYRRTLDTYCEPIIVETEQKVDFENLIHPLLEDGVPNALNVNQNILLTGSNASGKSTFMKAVAINLILAQTLNIATADKFMYKPGLVYSSMVNVDDILSGDSYFMAELKSIRRLFNRSDDSPVYCFIDEIFKGTNTAERIAASESVLEYLSEQKEHRIIAATHDIELSERLKRSYENYHFNESIEDYHIYFDYKIKKGKANTRNAIELLRITQFPSDIYQRAKEYVKTIN